MSSRTTIPWISNAGLPSFGFEVLSTMTKVAPFWIYPKHKCQQCNTNLEQKANVKYAIMTSNMKKAQQRTLRF